MKNFLILLVLVVLVWWFGFRKEPSPEPASEVATPAFVYNNASDDLIKVELPFPGAVTGKDFAVIGQARGYWFFEATFPVDVLDKDGNILVQTYASAQADPQTGEVNWMTEEFVPFKANIVAPQSYIGPATLVLHKNNASGLPEHDASLSFPFVIEY